MKNRLMPSNRRPRHPLDPPSTLLVRRPSEWADDGSDAPGLRLSTNPSSTKADTEPQVAPDGGAVTLVRHKVGGKKQALLAVDIGFGRSDPVGAEGVWPTNRLSSGAAGTTARGPQARTVGCDGFPRHPPPRPEEGGRRPPSVCPAAQNGQFPGFGSSMRLAAPFGSRARSRRRPFRRRPVSSPSARGKMPSSREDRSIR